jgi:hypothetical protein
MDGPFPHVENCHFFFFAEHWFSHGQDKQPIFKFSKKRGELPIYRMIQEMLAFSKDSPSLRAFQSVTVVGISSSVRECIRYRQKKKKNVLQVEMRLQLFLLKPFQLDLQLRLRMQKNLFPSVLFFAFFITFLFASTMISCYERYILYTTIMNDKRRITLSFSPARPSLSHHG